MGCEVAVRVESLSHDYGSGGLRRRVLSDVGVDVAAGEIVMATGPSGSGKSTLLTLIGALRAAQTGSLRVLGEELCGAGARARRRVRQRIGYVFQSHNLIAALSAAENIEVALSARGCTDKALARRRARAALEEVGLADRAACRPDELSGGQRQRVAIARALADEPELVLADEPTASLDRESGRRVAELLDRLARERGVTVLLVTHDARIVDLADRILHLEDGCLRREAS